MVMRAAKETSEAERSVESPTDSSSSESGVEAVFAPTSSWFQSMLRSFLTSYVVLLAGAAVWVRTGGTHARLLLIPILLLPSMYQFLLRPVHRRLALRAMARRSTAASVMLSIATATGVLVVSGTMTEAMRRTGHDVLASHLGPVDATIVAGTAAARLEALAAVERFETLTRNNRRSGSLSIADSTDGRLLFTTTRVRAFVKTDAIIGNVDALELDVTEAQRFGGNSFATGLDGLGPLRGEQAYVGSDLAAALRVKQGDVMNLEVGANRRRVVVGKVLPRRGLAALSLDGQARPRVIFVSPGLVSEAAGKKSPLVRYVTAFSAVSVGDAAWKRSRGLAELLDQALENASVANPFGEPNEPAPTPERIDASAVAVKAVLREFVERDVDRLTPLVARVGALSGLGAIGSLVAAMVMAVRSRRRELHALRAIGLRRADAFSVLQLELALLSLAGVVFGGIFGVLVVRFLLIRSGVSDSGPLDGGLRLRLLPSWTSVTQNLVVAFAVVTGTSTLATAFAGRGDVGGGLRGEVQNTEPLTRKQRLQLSSVVVLLFGFAALLRSPTLALVVLAMVVWLAEMLVRSSKRALVRLVGFVLLIAGVGVLIGHKRVASTGSALSAFEYAIVTAVVLLAGTFAIGDSAVEKFFGRLPFGRESALRARLRRVKTDLLVPVTAWLAGRLDRPSLLARRPIAPMFVQRLAGVECEQRGWIAHAVRLMASLAGFTVVLSTLATSAVRVSTERRASDARGRFDLLVRNAGPANLEVIRSRPDVGQVLAVRSRLASFALPGKAPQRGVLSSVDSSYSAAKGVARLSARLASLPSDEAAFENILAKPGAAIVDESLLLESGLSASGLLGRELFLADPSSGRSSTVEIVATMRSSAGLGSVVLSPTTYDALMNKRPSDTTYLVDLLGRSNEQRVSSELRIRGIEASPFAEVARQSLRGPRTVASLLHQLAYVVVFGGLLSGLIVIASALATRKRDFASLRSLGATDALLRSVVGSTYHRAGLHGFLLGAVASLLSVPTLLKGNELGLSFEFPIVRILLSSLFVLIVGRVVLWLLLYKTLRTAPAPALRSSGTS